MKDNIEDFLQDCIVKYSQGLIFWSEQSNNEDNSPNKAKECENNIIKYRTLYNEFNLLIEQLNELGN